MSQRAKMLAGWIAVSFWLNPALDADELTTPVHLVGHEDIDLLARVQGVIDDSDPRKLTNPVFQSVEVYGEDGSLTTRKILRRSDLGEFIADVTAAEALGKAFFWEMQAGSDFRRLEDGTWIGTACASCHYRNGTDARTRHTARVPHVAWNKYKLDPIHPLALGEKQREYDVSESAELDVKQSFFDGEDTSKYGNLSLIIGSAGVRPLRFDGMNSAPTDGNTAWEAERSVVRTLPDVTQGAQLPEWSMFVDADGRPYRQITRRNTPTVINSGFADRLFHDGRAESTFNGFSIHGDRDHRTVLYRGLPAANDTPGPNPIPVRIAITNAALASQAVEPITSDVEMSYQGRTFPDVAGRLLDARILCYQEISENDSVLGGWKKKGLIGSSTSSLTYRGLIQRAFRREWWDGGKDQNSQPHRVPLTLSSRADDKGDLATANFSLFWGLSIMLYEASLVSNQSPYDDMLLGDKSSVVARWEEEKDRLSYIYRDAKPDANVKQTSGTAVFQQGLRIFLRNGCSECHSGPLFSELYERLPEPALFPIHERMASTLLPNSRSDSIAINREAYRRQIREQISNELVQGPARLALSAAQRLARSLDQLREQARGDRNELTRLISDRLKSLKAESSAEIIAEMLMKFEKEAVKHYGDRFFFSEDERIKLAGDLLDPVMVERLPLDAETKRPLMPYQGPYAATKYFFYDTGFYNLGSGYPRYDRGIGGWSVSDASASDSDASAVDSSWDRNYVPENHRRSDIVFYSRSRTLVSDEDPWGFRKPLLHDNELAFWGAFKTPTLRNVELTAPYMHNGRKLTLGDVIKFYIEQDVAQDVKINPDKHPKVTLEGIEQRAALEFFLMCLTDERVRNEEAPFDHPSITIVDGYDDDDEQLKVVSATGAEGRAASERFPAPFSELDLK